MADESNAVIIDMLRVNQRDAEARSETRHAEVLKAVNDIKTNFEAHEAEDEKRFDDIDKWRNRIIGGGIVVVTVLSWAAPAVAQAFGIGA